MLVALPPGIDQQFERRRGRGEHHREAAERAQHHRHVAGMVADTVLLLEGRLVLLVDHDETEIAPRQEQRRARPHHHFGRPRCDAEPHPLALARPDPRMPFRRLRLEPALDPFEKALGEGDFRQQQQHLPALRQRRRHRLEIDLGLARAGDAVDQRDREAARRHRPAQLLGRRRLLRIEGDPVAQRIGGGEGQERRQRHLRQGPLPGQAAHHPDPDRRFRRELVCPERHRPSPAPPEAPAPAAASASPARPRRRHSRSSRGGHRTPPAP